MLLLTIISNCVSSILTPKVKISEVSERVITHKIFSEGEVNVQNEIPITVLPELLIKNINVVVGQEIEREQLLFEIDKQSIVERKEDINQEIQMLELQKQDYLNQRVVSNKKRENNISRAQESYGVMKDLSEKKIEDLIQKIGNKQAELQKIDSTKLENQETIEALKNQLSDLENSYDLAVDAQKKSMIEIEQQVAIASEEIPQSTLVEQTELQIIEKNKLLDQLIKLEKTNGEIRAKQSGTVMSVNQSAGNLSSKESVIMLSDNNNGLKLTLPFSKDEQRFFKIGDEVIIYNSVTKNVNKEQHKINAISVDNDNLDLLNVSFSLINSGYKVGELLTGEVNVSSNKYDTTVPLTAIHVQSENMYYVNIIKSKKTINGETKIVEQKSVDIIDKNSEFAAVKNIEKGDMVVIDTTKELKNKTMVKVNE